MVVAILYPWRKLRPSIVEDTLINTTYDDYAMMIIGLLALIVVMLGVAIYKLSKRGAAPAPAARAARASELPPVQMSRNAGF